MINYECPVCGRTHIVLNPKTIDRIKSGERVPCPACEQALVEEYVRGHYEN
jgi:predicted SprT family Zn-dependent metalloprotease